MKTDKLNDLVEPKFGFTLRKMKTHCLVYLTVKQRVTHKIPLGIKCQVGEWDKKRHLTKNPSDNEKILSVKLAIMRNFEYLCTSDVDTIRQILNIEENIIMPKARTPRASTILEEALKALYEDRPKIYKVNKTYLNRYLSYLQYLRETDRRMGGDSIEKLKVQHILSFRTWLVEKKLSIKTINESVALICLLINRYVTETAKYIKYNVEKVSVTKLKSNVKQNDKKLKLIPWSSIDKFLAYVPDEKEKATYDIALLLFHTGLRYENALDLLNGRYIDNGNGTVTVKTNKASIYAHVILNDTIERIMRERQGYSTDNRHFDYMLKRMWAKFDDSIDEYKEQKGNEILNVSKPFAKNISAHYFRHTFITRKLREGVRPELIIKMVGHADTTMIERVYGHLTHEQENELFVKNVNLPKKKEHQLDNEQVKPIFSNVLMTDDDYLQLLQDVRDDIQDNME